MEKRVLITDHTHPVLQEMLERAGVACKVDAGIDYEGLKACVDDYDALVVRSKVHIDRPFLDACHRLRCIGRVGAGMETIDVDYAESRGIRCLNSPEGNRDAVGEHTLGLLLSLFDRIAHADSEVRQGLWKREENRGLEIKGRTIGIIGMGNMGGSFARRLMGFDCEVLACDLLGAQASGFALAPFAKAVTLNQLQEQCDVVSLHLPLTPQTHYFVDNPFWQAFRKPFFLLNTSRGAVVNTAHLVEGMQHGRIRGVALDVIEYEDMSRDGLQVDAMPQPFRYLVNSERAVLTPHVAGWTEESKYRLAAVLAQKIIDCLC